MGESKLTDGYRLKAKYIIHTVGPKYPTDNCQQNLAKCYKGAQIDFLQKRLEASLCKYHIVMCRPPLIAHNPERTEGMAPYIVAEQDARLQKIINENKNVLSGHTHVSPSVEFDEAHSNLYINDGSICPTAVKNKNDKTQQGNIALLEISKNEIFVIVKGIHTEDVLFSDKYNY